MEKAKATITAAVMSDQQNKFLMSASDEYIRKPKQRRECDMLVKLVRQIAMNLSLKSGERYSDVVGFITRRLRFDLLRTCVIALRGYKKNAAPEKIEDLEFNLRPVLRVFN